MALLDRYLKKGGFVQLVKLIETSVPSKKQKLIQLIRDENPGWATELESKMIQFSWIAKWKPADLKELVARVPIDLLAAAIYPMDLPARENFFESISVQDRPKVQRTLGDRQVPDYESQSAQLRYITEARNLFVLGLLKYEAVDPTMIIFDNVEELLGKNSVTKPTVSAMDSSNLDESRMSNVDYLQKQLGHLKEENQILKQQVAILRDELAKHRKRSA